MVDIITLNEIKKLENYLSIDHRKEGYPLFCVWGGNGNTNWISKIYNSDFEPVGSPWGSFADSTTSYRAGVLADPTFGYSTSDFGAAHTQLTTSAFTSYEAWQQSLHQNDQYPASAFGSVSSQGYQTFYSLNSSSTKAHNGFTLINQVLPKGIRPRRYFGMYDNSFVEYSSLTQMNHNIDYIDLSNYSISRSKLDGRGSAGYNEKTNTLVTLHGDTTNICTLTKFVSTVNLNKCNNLQEFFDNATVTELNHTLQIYDAQSRYDKVVIVGDNDWIGLSYRNGNNLMGEVVDFSGNNEPKINLNTISGTTSYGLNNGNYYYTKMNLTWDGKWAAAYQPYYYYGCGCNAYIFSTEDPRRNFRINNTQSSGGGALIPVGKSGFVLFNGQNADNTDIKMVSWDFKKTNRGDYTQSTFYTHSNLNLNSVTPQISNGGLLNANSSNNRSGITGYSNSSNYPRIMTVNYWPTNGRLTYEGER